MLAFFLSFTKLPFVAGRSVASPPCNFAVIIHDTLTGYYPKDLLREMVLRGPLGETLMPCCLDVLGLFAVRNMKNVGLDEALWSLVGHTESGYGITW